jgi:predicted O-methyltransferase YrrM
VKPLYYAMSEKLWSAVDDYLNALLLPQDAALDAAVAASTAAGLPAIAVAPNQGKLLYLLARMSGAKSILEIGTLGGYSTIWLARALPADGRLVTLEYEPRHAEVARANIARAGLAPLVDVRVGKALDLLPGVQGPFDLTFIDADKANIPDYVDWAVRLSRPGSVIIVDNVIRHGEVISAISLDPNVRGVRRMFDAVSRDPRLDATALQTVGSKGYDGLAIMLVK